MILRETDSTATGSTEIFLSSKLRFVRDASNQDICMLGVGQDEVGVMMGWERGIMTKTVERLCKDHPKVNDLKVLNVGFGLGIVSPPLLWISISF